MAQNIEQQELLEEEASSFDLFEWIFKILQYWYLFLIGLVIALGFAYLKNRKWIAQYESAGTLIIKETGISNQTLMNGFGVDAGYRNVNNQVIMLNSYDLMSRVIDSLPYMNVEYITQGRFKTRNIYRNSPIFVEDKRVAPFAYGILYAIELKDDGSYLITSTNEGAPLKAEGQYGQPLSTDHFDITVWPTQLMVNSGKMYFRFRNKESLVNEFIGRVGLGFVGENSTVLRISMVSETPDRDCEFIDKLSEIFLLENLERKNAVADNSLRFINHQINLLQQSLQVSEGAMTNFRQQNKIVDVSAYASTLMSRMESFDAEEMNLKLKETYLDYLDNYLTTNMEAGSIVAPTSLGLDEQMLLQLVTQLNDLTLLRSELSEKNVYYAKYTTDIENVKKAINEVVCSMRASLEIEKKDLQRRSSEVANDIRKLPEKELEMVSIERNYRIDDNYYTFFLQKRAEAEIQRASNTPDNEILDRARVISMINGSAKKKTYTSYCLIGLLIPLILIILSELLNTQIRTPKELLRLSKFPLVGTLRHVKSQNPTLVVSAPRSSFAEMLRSMRTRIEFVVQRKSNIMIAITSTQPADGKTFTSTNLAAIYAMTGKKTLLVDLDIRKPNIHEMLGLEGGLGVTNYLIGDCQLEDIIDSNTPYAFDFVRAGTIPPNPGELVRSERMSEMLCKLREKYDFIILDTSPIGHVSDAYALIGQSDLTLFVVRCAQTNKNFCKATLEQLAVDYSNICLVLSDVPAESHKYGYYSGYGYGGYGYGYGASRYGLGYGKRSKKHFNYYTDDEDA